MRDNPGILQPSTEKAKKNFSKNLLFFFFLVILPFATMYLAVTTLQANLETEQQKTALDEMAEITAHISRLSNPETYFQDRLRRLSDSFRWASAPSEISSIGYKDALELFLFDHQGKRIKWKGGEKGKIRISESYLELVKRLNKEPANLMSRREQSLSASFSGNAATVYSLGKSPETLINFQGLGLRKLGVWFRPRFRDGKEGSLLAFVNPDKVSKHHLAERAIRKIQRFAGTKFGFAWIDLNKPEFSSCTGKVKLTAQGRDLLSLNGLKSGFRYEEMLFSINDTPEGIRLICYRDLPAPPRIRESFFNLLRVIIPFLFLFLVWKTVFQVRLDLSVNLQFSLIFGYTALTGILILLSGISAFQSQKQTSLIADRKHQAIQILEKIDRNFTASYGDLLRQYRHFSRLLNQPDAKPKELLAPLQKAHEDDTIAFAGFTDTTGNFLFRAPEFLEEGNTTVLEVKYANLINSVSLQIINTFNSSRQSKNLPGHDVIGVTAITARPVEGLLHNRSTLQNIVFDGDETMTFMDLAINASDTATGCLFIVHEPLKMQLKYLGSSGNRLTQTTGFQLIAFPKKVSDKKSYFPRYSMTNELPLWKLQDLVNQTQVSSFKIGRIDKKEVLVAATPGHNLKNFNLFLVMPLEPIKTEARQLTTLFISAAILAIIFIAFLSGMLVRSLIKPISHLAHCASALTSSAKIDSISIPEGNELESISTGLADLIIKVREFNEGRSIRKHLLPPKALKNGTIVCDGFQISKSNLEREIYHFSAIDENTTLIFFMRTDLDGIEGSLNLSMARMAVRLISEELNVASSYKILKDLEEYFRINLRRKLGGDFFLGIFDADKQTLAWSGCGKVSLYLYNAQNNELEAIAMEPENFADSEFHKQGTVEMPFSEKMKALIVSPAMGKNCKEKLSVLLPVIADKDMDEVKFILQQEAERACGNGFDDSASMLLVQQEYERTNQ